MLVFAKFLGTYSFSNSFKTTRFGKFSKMLYLYKISCLTKQIVYKLTTYFDHQTSSDKLCTEEIDLVNTFFENSR